MSVGGGSANHVGWAGVAGIDGGADGIGVVMVGPPRCDVQPLKSKGSSLVSLFGNGASGGGGAGGSGSNDADTAKKAKGKKAKGKKAKASADSGGGGGGGTAKKPKAKKPMASADGGGDGGGTGTTAKKTKRVKGSGGGGGVPAKAKKTKKTAKDSADGGGRDVGGGSGGDKKRKATAEQGDDVWSSDMEEEEALDVEMKLESDDSDGEDFGGPSAKKRAKKKRNSGGVGMRKKAGPKCGCGCCRTIVPGGDEGETCLKCGKGYCDESVYEEGEFVVGGKYICNKCAKKSE